MNDSSDSVSALYACHSLSSARMSIGAAKRLYSRGCCQHRSIKDVAKECKLCKLDIRLHKSQA